MTQTVIDFEAAKRLRDAGLKQVEDNSRGWVERARTFAYACSLAQGQVTADDVRRWANAVNDHPHHPNAYGAIFRGKEWRLLGYTKSKFKSNHARRIGIWVAEI